MRAKIFIVSFIITDLFKVWRESSEKVNYWRFLWKKRSFSLLARTNLRNSKILTKTSLIDQVKVNQVSRKTWNKRNKTWSLPRKRRYCCHIFNNRRKDPFLGPKPPFTRNIKHPSFNNRSQNKFTKELLSNKFFFPKKSCNPKKPKNHYNWSDSSKATNPSTILDKRMKA